MFESNIPVYRKIIHFINIHIIQCIFNEYLPGSPEIPGLPNGP